MSPFDWVSLVTGMNFALGSYEKFQPSFRDEKRSKILGTRSGTKFEKQGKHGKTHTNFDFRAHHNFNRLQNSPYFWVFKYARADK